MCKFPEVKIQLVGEDGNAFAIMGRAISAAKRAGVSQASIQDYKDEATSGSYDNLLCVTMDWWNCDPLEENLEDLM